MVPFFKRINPLTSKINFSVNLRLFNYLKQTITFYTSFRAGIKFYASSRESGMTLIEVILIAVFLATMAIGTSYFFTQTKITMSSSSQVTKCQTIAKQALEKVVSLGSRLYGYKIHHKDNDFSYEPLFIKDNSGSIVDVGSGSELTFPPGMYNELYRNLGITPPTQDLGTNTGVPLIGAAYPFQISTAVLIVNSVNALQYLYNSDNGFFTSKGKMYTSNGGLMSSVLEKYKNQFHLENIKFYIRVAPINLQTEEEMTSPPSKILTRPRIYNPQGATLSPALDVLGDPDIGFEIKVTLEYERNDQEYTCDASHRFSHQIKIIAKRSQSISVNMTSLESGVGGGRDLLSVTDPDVERTSCDTHGSGYDDIKITVDFNNVEESQQIGTVILCQMNSYCLSDGDASYRFCSPEPGLWQRCHQIDPKPSSDQSWTYTSKLTSPQVLDMNFNGMKPNRRYDLLVGEFSMAGHNLRKKMVSRFYLDAKRPTVGNKRITNDAVGIPTDGIGGRHYNGAFTNWVRPLNAITSHWLQCNQADVEFAADLDDQFTHNLKDCALKGKREDGTNKGTGVATSPTSTINCGGTLSGIQQGRQTITITASDSCGSGLSSGDLVWDTDLPSLFETKDFANPLWLYSKTAYPIETQVPAKTKAGEFPKHYSVDCDDNFIGGQLRKDGNSGPLNCNLLMSNPDHDDGANPNFAGVQYYHVCGNSTCEDTKWGVYAPEKKSCKNVQCEPDLICCGGNHKDRQCTKGLCYKSTVSHPECTNPVGGSNQDKNSGCNVGDFGLYDCNYVLDCTRAKNSLCGKSQTDYNSRSCDGKRQGDSCAYWKFTCTPDDTSWNSTCQSDGTTKYSCQPKGNVFYTTTCKASCTSRCQTECSHIANGVKKHSCDVWEYQAYDTPALNFTGGTCHTPPNITGAGGCSSRGLGGGNLTAEISDIRQPLCGSIPPGVTLPACDSSKKCCTGDTCPSNSNCCDCVKKHGKACCTAASGGTCTGQLCADNCNSQATCHVRDLGDGVCRPTCKYLANKRSYGFGDDGIRGTGDDTFTGTWNHSVNICSELNTQKIWGSTNWLKIPLIDNIKPQEAQNGGECCGRGLGNVNELEPICRHHCKVGQDVIVINESSECLLLGGGELLPFCVRSGKCGNTPSNPCHYGEADPQPTSANDTWICKSVPPVKEYDSPTCGYGCDSNTECCNGDYYQINTLCPVCGADKDNPCINGTVSNLAKWTLAWRWMCSSGKTTIGCFNHHISESGLCNSSGSGAPGCIAGVKVISGSTWKCESIPSGGTTDGPCPLNGVCSPDSTHLTGCLSGTPDPNPRNVTKTWTCKGLGGGSDSSTCKVSSSGEDGICSADGCSQGIKKSESDSHNGCWKCKSTNGGIDSSTCPRNGICGHYTYTDNKGTCRVGTYRETFNGPNNLIWRCEGVHGGEASGHCIHALNQARCSNPCASGIKEAVTDSHTGCWKCVSEDAGTDSSICPRDGVCNSDGTGCTLGTYSSGKCLGLHGGHQDDCTNPLPHCECASSPNATCGDNSLPNNVINTTCCEQGYYHENNVDTQTEYKWFCTDKPLDGAPGQQVCKLHRDCSATRCQSGRCDIPNSKCLVGEKKTINRNEWKCLKTSGAGSCSDATCEALCDSTTTCCGGDTYPSNPNCPAPGECGASDGSGYCKKGVPKTDYNPGTYTGEATWKCPGANAGTEAPCSECRAIQCQNWGAGPPPPPSGSQDTRFCLYGQLDTSSLTSSGNQTQWTCESSGGSSCSASQKNCQTYW